MGLVLSLQGGMAVGKTTTLEYLKVHAPYLNICFEDNIGVVEEVRKMNPDRKNFNDFVEVQRLWINSAICRFMEAKEHDISVMDFGPEEIEFYTFAYPVSIKADWRIEKALHKELKILRECKPDRILFLEASENTLKKHNENDLKKRHTFDYYISNMLPLKKKWFRAMDNVDYMCIDDMDPEEMGEAVLKWVRKCMRKEGITIKKEIINL